MNSDNPDQVMENNPITSKNKKKSKGKLKTESALTDVIGRSPKKSFWKSLFRFKKHHDPGNSSTHVITVELGANNEESKSTPSQRLSSIFEETQDPATLDPKTIAEDISEIKKTIKRMSETSNPSVIIDKMQNYPSTNSKSSKKRTKEDAFLGYLSDISSTSSEADDDDEEDKKLDEHSSQEAEYCGVNQDNTSTYTDLLGDDKPNKGSSSLIKEGYSFEYSETSENSNDDAEDKPEKVTFDNKVETKDANSIITVRPLDENDSKIVIEEITEKPEEDEKLKEISEEDEIVARIQKIVNGENNSNEEEEPEKIDTTNPENQENQDSYSLLMNQTLQKPTNRTFFSIPPEDVTAEVDQLANEGSNRFTEESEASTSSISKQSTFVHHDLDETLDIESIEEETELWMEDLNEFPFISTPDMVPLEDLDDDTNIDNEIFREFRLNKFFKMIQNNITMNVSIAYDPLFENEPMIQNFHSTIVEQAVRNEERNKVIRKRKMMSLLHDKQVFKDYLKEIEEANMSSASKIEDVSEITTIPIKTSGKKIDINTNIFDDSTKNKLEKFLNEDKNNLKTNNNPMYAKQYLHVYNLQTNRQNEDGFEENTSTLETYSASSEGITQIESDTSVGKTTSAIFNEDETVEKLTSSLQTKISAYQTIDRDVEDLISELMGHVSDLKQSCIKYGAVVSNETEEDPILFTTQEEICAEVHEIMNEILQNVFTPANDVFQITLGHFNQCFSFIREFGHIEEEKTTLSYQINPIIKNVYQTENSVSLAENLQRANGYLSTVYEEMCEYNPVPMLESETFRQNENIQDVAVIMDIDDDYIDPMPDHSLIYSENLIDFDYQPDFETELSIIHEEDEPSSSINEPDNTTKTSMDMAENIIQFIEKSVTEKLSVAEDFQDYDDETLNITREEATIQQTKSSILDCDIIQQQDNIILKCSPDSDYATASNSRDNKFEPQPGTSKQPANCFIKNDKSSATICSSVYHLPSVPSTELIYTDNSSQHSGVVTLLSKKFSELPNGSMEDINPEDLRALLAFQVPSNFSQGVTMLERKSPQTNLLQLLRNLSIEDTKNLTKTEVDKCIEENLKCFQESIKETIKLNQKTIDMIKSSSGEINQNQTPDVLTIISTLSCNVPGPPQIEEKEVVSISKTETESITAKTSEPPQEWYGNNFFSKTTKNNSVPKLYKLSEKVFFKSEMETTLNDESLKDDSESTFSNHNFDVDTYTDISFEESTELNHRLKTNGESETVYQSEYSLDTQYLSCSNLSSQRDDDYSGKSRDSKTEETTNSKKSETIQHKTTKICSDLQNLMTGDLATKYLEKRFNFGINLSTLLNEEFERKAKLNFGEQIEGDQNQLSNIPEEDEDDGIGSTESSSSTSTITVVAITNEFEALTIEENPRNEEIDEENATNLEVTDSNEILDNPDIMKNAEL